MTKNSEFKQGVFWALLNAFLWGTTFICSRYLMRSGSIDAVSISLIRFIIGAAVLFSLGLVFFRKQVLSVKLKDILGLFGLGAFGIGGMSVLLFAGQQWSTAINAALITELNPIIILFLGLFVGEKICRYQYIGIFLGLLGCMLVVGVITADGIGYEMDHFKGDFCLFMAGACWAVYTVLSKGFVKRLGSFCTITWAMSGAALALIPVWLLLPYARAIPAAGNTEVWLVILYLAIFPTAVAYFAWCEAMGKIELSLLNASQYLTPVFTIILAWLLLSESMTLLNIIGAVMVLAGVALTSKQPKAPVRAIHPD